jgi:hypothetical protein
MEGRMLRILGYTIFLYLVLKLCRLLVRPAAGDRDNQPTLRALIRAGEPMLAIGIFGFAAMIAIYAGWWGQRFNQGQYSYSSDCYARMAASHHLPGRPARFGSYNAARAAEGHLEFAEIHGSKLGLRHEIIDRKLNQAQRAYSAYYAGLAARGPRQKIAALDDLDRCLKGEGAPRGELLTPNI